ncbi:hypothetical protein DH2020_036875 [Rehmannia glutinosa]|uniref:Uncharacterized protein n=1 Tax=Rehmannia glutinosa TaxID=99300 RepID=A0ABR0V515_REHGL
MEVFGKSMVAVPTNVIFLSSILGQDGPNPVHKCDWKCENENVCGNMYRCRLTGLTHICDKNCNQRILYDNHSSLCRVSKQIFPLTPIEQQAVKGVRRKLDSESCSTESFAFKRKRDAQFNPSPFERSFTAVVPFCREIFFCSNGLHLTDVPYEANDSIIEDFESLPGLISDLPYLRTIHA